MTRNDSHRPRPSLDRMKPKEAKTSWGNVAKWYDTFIEDTPGTYQTDVVLPNIIRILEITKGKMITDVACGQGFFAREFAKAGANVIAADVAKELIDIAEKNTPPSLNGKIKFRVAEADKLTFIPNASVDAVTIIFAIQNIENVSEVLAECARVLRPTGRLVIVMNHPAFRVPKGSDWGWDEAKKVQYRRVDRYITESKVKIQMHPGDNPDEYTLSFHRPLQFYMKALRKNNFAISRLEEWTSHKKSGPGPRAEAEDRARKEFPMFLCLEAIKYS